jgi:hypothetical protein
VREEGRDGFGPIVLGVVPGLFDQVKRRIREQAGHLGGKCGT